MEFQSTLRRTERLKEKTVSMSRKRFQSTLRRTERRIRLENLLNKYKISIHAPTNGATAYTKAHEEKFNISIHAPTNGATIPLASIDSNLSISIHAPTNGATVLPIPTIQIYIFQSTLRRTERPLQNAHSKAMLYFNPRSDERSDNLSKLILVI